MREFAGKLAPMKSRSQYYRTIKGSTEKNVLARKPKNVQDLWEICQQEWEKIPIKLITEFYNSIGRRIAAVIAAKGQHTKYS